MTSDQVGTMREAVAVYQTVDALRSAIRSLKRLGLDRSAITLVADPAATEEKLGRSTPKTVEIAEPGVDPRARFILERTGSDHMAALLGAGIAYAGAFAAAIAAVSGNQHLVVPALLGTLLCGALAIGIAAMSGRYVNPTIDTLARHFKRGEFLIWVRLDSPELEERALKALSRNAARDVHVFEIPASA